MKQKLRAVHRCVLSVAVLLLAGIDGVLAQSITGTPDDTPGVFLFSAGGAGDPAVCDSGAPGAEPTDDIILSAVAADTLAFIGDDPAEVYSFSWGPAEGNSAQPDTTSAKVNEGLTAIDDYGFIANGGDDAANFDTGTQGEFCGGFDQFVIAADGVLSSGTMTVTDASNPDVDGNLGGMEIFIFEDAELSGVTITLYSPFNAYTIVIDDRQIDPNASRGTDDTLIGIDLDAIPGWDGSYITSLCIKDDGIQHDAGDCGTYGDTSLEIDAIASRKATLIDRSELPVELALFSAFSTPNATIMLTWKTLSESDNAGFEVEFKRPGQATYDQVGWVAGYGTTTESIAYSWESDQLTPGLYSIRLRQLDFSGAVSYSKAIEVVIENSAAVVLQPVYPNPVTGSATIDFSVGGTGDVSIDLFDMQGRAIKNIYSARVEAGSRQQIVMDASSLASGTYVVKLLSNGHQTQRFFQVWK